MEQFQIRAEGGTLKFFPCLLVLVLFGFLPDDPGSTQEPAALLAWEVIQHERSTSIPDPSNADIWRRKEEED